MMRPPPNSGSFPGSKPLPASTKSLPYMLVADDAFLIKDYIQKPYSKIGLTKEFLIIDLAVLAGLWKMLLANRPQLDLDQKRWKVFLWHHLRSQSQACSVHTPSGCLDQLTSEFDILFLGTHEIIQKSKTLIVWPFRYIHIINSFPCSLFCHFLSFTNILGSNIF